MTYAGPWSTTGYSISVPTISTTALSNDTCASDGSPSPSDWATGNAATTITGSLQAKILDSVAAGHNCIIGHTTYNSSNISNNTLNYSEAEVVTSLRFQTGGFAIPKNDETNKVTYVADDIFKIDIDGTAVSYKKNDVEFETDTIAAGDYYCYSTSDNGNAYRYQLLGYSTPSTGGGRLPPPPIVLGGL